MNNKKIILLALTIGFLLIPGVLGIGITPGRTTLEYESGTSKTIGFSVVNNEGKDISVVVIVQGEFNQSIALSEVSFEMSANEESKNLQYTITMPENLKPGQHASEIVALQLPGKSATSEAFVGATVGVATQLNVFVPFPGKYAEAELNIIGPDDKQEIIFAMPVTSRGDLDLARVRATVDIYTSLNEKVATVNTNEISLPSQKKGEVVARWDSTESQPGPYRAVATIIYDEQTINLEKEFVVGEQALELQTVEVNDFSLGGIAKFEMLVENKWSQPIIGAYTQMNVFNEKGVVMADFKSPTQDIPELNKALMVSFWDTAGVGKGMYDATVFLRYGAKSQQQDFELEVTDREIKIIGVGYVISEGGGGGGSLLDNSLVVILFVVIGVLVLINLLWFLMLRKKIASKKSK